MATVTEHAAGVLGGGDLGEAGGLGGVLLVAAAAEIGDVGEDGLDGAGIVGVLSEGSVTRFAGDMGVAAGGADLGLIVVAEDARILAGEGDWFGADGVEGAGPVVAVFAETLRHNGGADDHKEAEGGEEDKRRANEMRRISKYAVQLTTPFVLNATGYCRALGTKDTKRSAYLKMLYELDFCGNFRRLMAFPTS
jgi:hypothetical protein